jgi:hypothetical protein
MKLKAAGWVAVAIVGTLVVLTLIAAAGSRTEPLRKLVVATLADRLDSDVELQYFSVDLFPTVIVYGEGLTVRLRNLPNSNIPPLIQIESFTVHCGIVDLLRRPRHFKHVTLEKLVINIPPGGLRKSDNPTGEAASTPAADKAPPSTDEGGNQHDARVESPIIVDELVADGALLRIIPRRAGKDPKEFAIQSLTMRSLGYWQQMPFAATLTNPIPKGQIETSGTFGPWQKEDPGSTPLGGKYKFENANLDTIDGIGGILNSTGTFTGQLERIGVIGEARIPDFHLDISKHPVPLTTTFETVVDGTDGDTYLNKVEAQLLKTSIKASGAITGTKGVKGRTIKLKVHIPEGRIEDLLTLAVKGDKPLMTGRVGLDTEFDLPPGDRDVIEKLQLAGKFDVDAAKFTDREVQQKLSGMSQRARGREPEGKADNVVSDLSGRFTLRRGTLSFADLQFGLPGALVQLHGTYGLRSETLAFDGTLRMQATVSQAVGADGLKGFLLKAIDPIFRKKGAGALIPIRIRGTREKPDFGVDVGRVFKSK